MLISKFMMSQSLPLPYAGIFHKYLFLKKEFIYTFHTEISFEKCSMGRYI